MFRAALSTTEKIGDKKSAINARTKQAIPDYMKDKDYVKARDVAEAIHLKPSQNIPA